MALYFTKCLSSPTLFPDRKSPEVIAPSNFPSMLHAMDAQMGQKRKYDQNETGEDVILYSDTTGGLVMPNTAARTAGLDSVRREFGTTLPHAFIRPAYK